MSLNDLMIKKKKTACFPRQFERSKVEWSIHQDKIFFPDVFVRRSREIRICRRGRWFERQGESWGTQQRWKLTIFNLSSGKEGNSILLVKDIRFRSPEIQLNQFDFYFPLFRLIVLLLVVLSARQRLLSAPRREKSSDAIR